MTNRLTPPIDQHELFETEPGKEYLENFEGSDAIRGDIFTEQSVDSEGFLQRRPLSDADRTAKKQKVAQWLTGNFDPETGLHTVYRGVDDVRLRNFYENGSLNSRLYEYFGDGSDRSVIKSLKDTARGRIPKHVKRQLDAAVEKNHAEIDFGPEHWYNQHYQDTLGTLEAVSEGSPSQAAKDRLLASAQDLKTVLAGGRSARELLVERASDDFTPPVREGSSLGAVLHPLVHTSTNPEFIRDRMVGVNENNWFDSVLEIQFLPDALPISAEANISDGSLILPRLAIGGFSSEYEWSAYGKIDSRMKGVSVRELSSDELDQLAAKQQLA